VPFSSDPDYFRFIFYRVTHFPYSRITTNLSAPDSGNHTSPGRPRIWRTLALRLVLLSTVNCPAERLDEGRDPPKRQGSENKSVRLAMLAFCRPAGPGFLT